MIFAILGLLQDPQQPHDPNFEAALNEQLAQPFVRIVSAGYVRDEAGSPIGFLGLVDVESFSKLRAFFDNSPFSRSGLYKEVRIGAYTGEVGRIG